MDLFVIGKFFLIDFVVNISQLINLMLFFPRINDFLSHVNLGERTIEGCLEAYSCKYDFQYECTQCVCR